MMPEPRTLKELLTELEALTKRVDALIASEQYEIVHFTIAGKRPLSVAPSKLSTLTWVKPVFDTLTDAELGARLRELVSETVLPVIGEHKP